MTALKYSALFWIYVGMKKDSLLTLGSILSAAGALIHGVIYWSVTGTTVLFGAGMVVGFGAELFVTSRGWLKHHVTPAIVGIPLYILCGWVVTLYVAIRASLFLFSGWEAALFAAVLATCYDMVVDHIGVHLGLWSYTGGPSGPSLGAVPWWNFAGWLLITGTIAGIIILFL